MGANDSHGGDDVGGGVASKDDSSVIPLSVIGEGFNYVHVMGGIGWKERSAEHRKWRVNKDREFAGHGDDVQGVARETIPHRQYGIILKDFGSAFDKVIGKSKMDTSVNCNICDENFNKECELKTHMEKEHTKGSWQIVQGKKTLEKNGSQDEKLLIENECENIKTLNINEEEIAILEGKNSGHRRTGPQTESQKIHSTDTNYNCPVCKQKLESTGLLKAHMESQHVEQIQCNLCDKSFHEKYDLEIHIQNEHSEGVKEEWNLGRSPQIYTVTKIMHKIFF